MQVTQKVFLFNNNPFRLRKMALVVALSGFIQVSQADPTCDVFLSIPGGVVSQGSPVTNSAGNACFDNATTSITNGGYITNNHNSGLTNLGVLSNTYGSMIWNYGVLTNNAGAEIYFSNSTSLFNGGAATLNNKGLLKIGEYGTITSEGILTNSVGATLINNSKINNSVGATFTNYGTYTTQFSGNLINSGSVVNEAGALWNDGFITINSNATMTNKSTIQYSSLAISGSFFNNSGALINLAGADTLKLDKANALLVNNGSITLGNHYGRMNVAAGASVIGSGSIEHSGAELVVDGLIQQTSISVYDNYPPNIDLYSRTRVVGTGTIESNVSMQGGVISAGRLDTTGTLNIDGDFSFEGTTLRSNIFGKSTGQFDTLNITGDITLTGGIFQFDFGSYKPTVGDSWMFLVGDTRGLSLDEISFLFFQPKGFSFVVNVLDNGLQLKTVSYTPPVPVPATAWFLGSGIAGLLGVARRKSKG